MTVFSRTYAIKLEGTLDENSGYFLICARRLGQTIPRRGGFQGNEKQ